MARGTFGSAQEKSKMSLDEQKSALRKKIRAVSKILAPELCKLNSQKLCASLSGQSFFQTAKSILFFAPMPGEPDIWPLLEETLAAGKIVAKPRFDSIAKNYVASHVRNLRDEIVTGKFGIREPAAHCAEIPLQNLDLILVPGVAFDLQGRRLGRGKGYYDRLLEKFSGTKCGIAFDEQIVDEIPARAHDIKMDFILTPTRCAEIAKEEI